MNDQTATPRLDHREPQTHERAVVLGTPVDRVDMAGAVARCEEALRTGFLTQHMAVNAAKLVSVRSDAAMRDAVVGSELITADGQAVVWASRLLGDPLPCRVAGIDLMWELLAFAARGGHRVYILGAAREVLETAVDRIRAEHPGIVFAGYHDGYFAESEEDAVADAIAATRPSMLFVAISSPRKELFLAKYRERLGAAFVMGVGGSIDVAAGVTRRAPNVEFTRLVLTAALRQRLGRRDAPAP
jgi:N-acetylglucosaminyldiphosphoundecaprenol N-acetyl-beta-D-mannosaminyltransferase